MMQWPEAMLLLAIDYTLRDLEPKQSAHVDVNLALFRFRSKSKHLSQGYEKIWENGESKATITRLDNNATPVDISHVSHALFTMMRLHC